MTKSYDRTGKVHGCAGRSAGAGVVTLGRRLLNDTSGATAALYALALPALVAAAGIGFDYAHVASLDTEMQNAADQAALAGATQLDQSDGATDRAIAAARGGLVSNSTLFANDEGASQVDIPEGTIYFYETRADAEGDVNRINLGDDDADADARFIRVVTETRTANYTLTPVVGVFSGEMIAEAVAGIGSALCRTPPLMICNPDEPDGNKDDSVDFNANAHIGEGLLAKGGGGSKWAPGNFGYLDTVPGSGGGTPDLMRAMGWSSPPGTCISQDGNLTVDMEPGNHASVGDALNTRFDIYNGNLTNVCPAGGNCPASANSVKDVVHPASNVGVINTGGSQSCEMHNSGWQQVASAGRYLPTSNAALSPTGTMPTAMGHPRDICHSTSSNNCPDGPFGDAFWDRDAYFRVNYGWTAAEWPGYTGLTPAGGARPDRPTRYQVYQWEMENKGDLVGGVRVLDPRVVTPSRTSYGAPQCSSRKGYGAGTEPSDTVADRRRVSVAVVNCEANNVRGSSNGVPVRRWMDVFLVQPSLDRDRTKKDEIYVEIIGETTRGSAGETAGTVIRRDVPFLIQ